MDFEYGVRHQRPDEMLAVDFIAALDEATRGRVGGMPLRLELNNGTTVEGILNGVSGERGVLLEERDTPIPSEVIVAVTLIDDEPPIDHSDELGRG